MSREVFKYLQRRFYGITGHPVPVLSHPHRKKSSYSGPVSKNSLFPHFSSRQKRSVFCSQIAMSISAQPVHFPVRLILLSLCARSSHMQTRSLQYNMPMLIIQALLGIIKIGMRLSTSLGPVKP